MTAPIALDEPFRRLLVGDDADSHALAGTVSEQGFGGVAGRLLRQATDSARSAVDAEVMRSVDELLDLELGGLLVAGWRKHRTLTAAAEQSRAAPGTSVVVSLAEHTVTSTHRRVDLLVEERWVASIHLELSVRFTVKGLAATVRDGKLVALTGGAAEVSVELSIEGRELAHRTARVDLPLADGIPLDRQPAADLGPRQIRLPDPTRSPSDVGVISSSSPPGPDPGAREKSPWPKEEKPEQ